MYLQLCEHVHGLLLCGRAFIVHRLVTAVHDLLAHIGNQIVDRDQRHQPEASSGRDGVHLEMRCHTSVQVMKLRTELQQQGHIEAGAGRRHLGFLVAGAQRHLGTRRVAGLPARDADAGNIPGSA